MRTAILSNYLKALCLLLVLDPQGRKLRMSFWPQGSKCICQLVRTTARPVTTVGAILYGGWVCLENGIPSLRSQKAAHITIAVSVANGGYTVDFRRLAVRGMNLVGMTSSFKDGVLEFAPDFKNNIAEGDANYL